MKHRYDIVIDEVINHLAKEKSSKVVDRYRPYFEELRNYCEFENIEESFTRKDAELFLLKYPKSERRSFDSARKVAYTVAEYSVTSEFTWKRISTIKTLNSVQFRILFFSYSKLLSKSLAPGTVRLEMITVRQFLFFLEGENIYDPKAITEPNILSFIQQRVVNHPNSKGTFFRALKRFISYLQEENIVYVNIDRYFMVPAKERKKVLPCFTDEEMKSLLSVIDTSTEKGCRDYAVFLTAARMGLRGSDIVKLKLNDINWHNNSIRIVQQKTKGTLDLPLPTDVGNAIAKYILSFRPKTDSPFVFLRVDGAQPNIPINPTSFNGYLRSYLKKAGIDRAGWDGKTFHAFRRTAATNLLQADTPVSTVSQILGHRSIESSMRYLSLHTEMLRECCMDLSMFETLREGLK